MIGSAIGASAIGEDGVSFAPPVIPVGGVDAGGSISGGTFTRGQWREIVGQFAEAERARQELLAKARNAKKAKKALEAAARAAKEAIEAAETTSIELAALTSAMQAATSARRVSDAIFEARRVQEIGLEIVRIAEQDEEESIMLLLMH